METSGTDPNSTSINEVSLGEDSPGSYDNTVKILPGSSLAAYYVPEEDNRYIIYQANFPARLHEYSPNTENVWGESFPAHVHTRLCCVVVNCTN
jgi:hypothetical protein